MDETHNTSMLRDTVSDNNYYYYCLDTSLNLLFSRTRTHYTSRYTIKSTMLMNCRDPLLTARFTTHFSRNSGIKIYTTCIFHLFILLLFCPLFFSASVYVLRSTIELISCSHSKAFPVINIIKVALLFGTHREINHRSKRYLACASSTRLFDAIVRLCIFDWWKVVSVWFSYVHTQ